jgi:hypothetical protein
MVTPEGRWFKKEFHSADVLAGTKRVEPVLFVTFWQPKFVVIEVWAPLPGALKLLAAA